MKVVIKFSVIVLVIFTFMGCKKEDHSMDEIETVSINRQEVLKYTAEQIIVPSFQTHKNSVDSLVDYAEDFKSQKSITSLNELRAQFVIAVSSWKHCELYNLGDIKFTFLHQKIHTWPVQETFIMNSINGIDSITPEYIDQKGSSSKGYAAIEFLLFGESQSMDSILVAFDDARRMDYLISTIIQLSNDSRQLLLGWEQYVPLFYSKDGSSLVSSLNQLVNEMVALNERVLGAKVGKPSGITAGSSPDSTLLELYKSGTSILAIQSNVAALEEVIFGRASVGGENLSVYLNSITGNSDLSNRILAQFEILNNKLAATNQPLKTLIYTQPNVVEEIYEETKDLLILLKVEFSSQLSVTLTINDNDGD